MKTKWRFTTTALKREIKNKKKQLEIMLQETVKLSNKFDFDNDPQKKYFEFQQIVKSKFKCSRAKHPSWTSFIATVFISFKLEVKKKHLSIFYKIVEFGQSCKQCSPKRNQYEKILMTHSSMKRLVKLFFFYVKKAYQNEWESKQQSIYCQPIPDAKNHLKKLCEACNAGVCPGLPENDCSESEDNDFIEISSSQSQIESFKDESDI